MKTGNKTGRPTKATKERCRRIMGEVSGGVSFDRACRLAGISDTTGWRWRQLGHTDLDGGMRTTLAKFVQDLDVALATRTAVLERDMWEEAKTNWQVRGWLLQRLHPDEYGNDTDGKARRQAINELLERVSKHGDQATIDGIIRAIEASEGAARDKPISALTTKERIDIQQHWQHQVAEGEQKLRELEAWYAEQRGEVLALAPTADDDNAPSEKGDSPHS